MTHRQRNLVFSSGLALGGLVVAFLLAEVITRLFLPEPILPRFVVDPGYGVRGNEPNVVTRHFFPNDYDVTISTNSVGMRGLREYSLDKPSDTYRIAVIGDSFIFGHGVNDNEVVSAVLEDRLNSDLAHERTRYEVINFSVSGFGQAEQLVTYKHRERHYKPDLVVLFYFSNDIGNNAISKLYQLNQEGQLERTGKSHLPGVALREILYKFAPTRWLFTHSQFWNFIRNRLSGIIQRSLLKDQGLKRSTDMKPEAVALTRALLQQFITSIKDDGARPIIFLIPQRNNKENRLETNFPMEKIELVSNGATLIDGRDLLSTEDYYETDGHWRPSGHNKAAKVLAAGIHANN